MIDWILKKWRIKKIFNFLTKNYRFTLQALFKKILDNFRVVFLAIFRQQLRGSIILSSKIMLYQ